MFCPYYHDALIGGLITTACDAAGKTLNEIDATDILIHRSRLPLPPPLTVDLLAKARSGQPVLPLLSANDILGGEFSGVRFYDRLDLFWN